jgi:hypothetical protein
MTKMTNSEIAHIVEGFKDMSLPEPEWTHEAHLVTALSLLRDYGLNQTEAIMPDMIRDYNTSRGGINSDSEGYHHTITIFYLRVLEAFRKQHPVLDYVALCNAFLESPGAVKFYPLEFYSKEKLFSVEARNGFLPPDIKPF